MPDSAEIGVGIMGLGFIGTAHLGAYERARRDGSHCRLVAVCDPGFAAAHSARRNETTAEKFASNLESSLRDVPPNWTEVTRYAAAADLLDDERVQLVSICTPTDTHVDLAIAALRAGKHVLVEKPVALAAADVRRLMDVAAQHPRQLIMPALCMRFWPGWDLVRDHVVRGTFGPVRSATFHRLGSRPKWSDFYTHDDRTGGALVDLHLHDADFIRWCFGDPDSVFSGGSTDHVTTIYRYERGPRHVVAEGGWDHTGGWPFRMKFVVVFERATVEYDSGRDPPLRFSCDDVMEADELDQRNGWEHEIREFVRLVAVANSCKHAADLAHEVRLRATLADAEAVARLLECERKSIETAQPVLFR